MELKRGIPDEMAQKRHATFNRTFMELKLNVDSALVNRRVAFNRTFMELKHA